MSDKINKGTRRNSSVAGASLMLGITEDTLEHFMPLIKLADDYHRSPDKIKRDELILRLDMYIINLKVEQLNVLKRKSSEKNP